jgi:hypothetical protein
MKHGHRTVPGSASPPVLLKILEVVMAKTRRLPLFLLLLPTLTWQAAQTVFQARTLKAGLCNGQLIPDSKLSFSSATAEAIPSFAVRGLCQL